MTDERTDEHQWHEISPEMAGAVMELAKEINTLAVKAMVPIPPGGEPTDYLPRMRTLVDRLALTINMIADGKQQPLTWHEIRATRPEGLTDTQWARVNKAIERAILAGDPEAVRDDDQPEFGDQQIERLWRKTAAAATFKGDEFKPSVEAVLKEIQLRLDAQAQLIKGQAADLEKIKTHIKKKGD